ncbi:regulator of cell autolysis [Taibaiella sp. KBW10]|uniref:tetratricopeptide repeat-containing sensor histidine kinase n=1 Tax=Taibaiella sp. KBW10 TaxID=2153357 RepID=UPI000F5A3638|nr:histidine kinase [Taibaiella sp. KBW10]RQO31570.1 regulator of cell autolysis [Taibaiella sp. KBW10]
MKYVLFLILVGIAIPYTYGQSVNTTESVSGKKANKPKSLGATAQEAENSVRSNDEMATADSYVRLAEVLRAQGEFARAEAYFERAAAIYARSSERFKTAEAEQKLVATKRKLAKAQEEQNKLAAAAKNYDFAGSNTKDGVTRQLNYNDASRLRTNSYEVQQKYSQNNLDLLTKAPEQNGAVQKELSDAYTQLAETQSKQDDGKGAIASLQKAVAADKENKQGAELVAQKISETLVQNNQIDDAIKLNTELIKSSEANQNVLLKISAYTQLGTLYAQSGKPVLAEENLKKAYDTAKSIYNTKAGKAALKSLLEYYLQTNQPQKAQLMMLGFLDDMDQLLAKDSSLMDMKAFEQSEQKIQQLEKEKVLQNEVIAQSKLSNYLLLTVVAIVALFLGFMIKAYYAIIKKNKQIKLQSLRREMNPHFVFNSLNSVNQFIAENDDRKANTYLNAYSRLMRTIMEHSNQDFVPLSVELDHLQKYLALEHQRFSNQFDYTISVDEQIEVHEVLMPNMILQPFLENAIWHGLRYKESKGLLSLSIVKKDAELELSITDDGIGIEHSLALKTKNQKAYKSLGMQNTQERISLLNSLYKTHIQYHIKDRGIEGASGTTVTLNIPIQKRNHED